MKWFFIKLIKSYQKKISKNTNPRCRHYPTCSTYGLICFLRYNFLVAGIMTLFRIIRCNPLFKGKYNPPRERKYKKADFVVSVIDERLYREFNGDNYSLLIKDNLESVRSFLKTADMYAKDDKRYLIILIKEKNLDVNKIMIKNFKDILFYETNENGKYKLNKALKKIEH